LRSGNARNNSSNHKFSERNSALEILFKTTDDTDDDADSETSTGEAYTFIHSLIQGLNLAFKYVNLVHISCQILRIASSYCYQTTNPAMR
jgi:hypothetical protein